MAAKQDGEGKITSIVRGSFSSVKREGDADRRLLTAAPTVRTISTNSNSQMIAARISISRERADELAHDVSATRWRQAHRRGTSGSCVGGSCGAPPSIKGRPGDARTSLG